MSVTDIKQLVIGSANKYGVPVDIALAQAQAESNFDPNAVSKAGAQGVMQLMPGTASDLGVTDSFNPVQNVDAGMKYLASLYQKFGDWTLALAAYNAGPGNVQKYGGIPPFQETQDYVTKVMAGASSYLTANYAETQNESVSDFTDPPESIIPVIIIGALLFGVVAIFKS